MGTIDARTISVKYNKTIAQIVLNPGVHVYALEGFPVLKHITVLIEYILQEEKCVFSSSSLKMLLLLFILVVIKCR